MARAQGARAQMSLAMRETIEGGDVFALRVRRPRSAGLVVPLQIELKEADHLDAAKFEDRAGGARIRYGIEHDSAGRCTPCAPARFIDPTMKDQL